MEPDSRLRNNPITEEKKEFDNGEVDEDVLRHDIKILYSQIASKKELHTIEMKSLKEENENLKEKEHSLQCDLMNLKRSSEEKLEPLSKKKKELEEIIGFRKIDLISEKSFHSNCTRDNERMEKKLEKYKPGCKNCQRVEKKYADQTASFEEKGRSFFGSLQTLRTNIENKKSKFQENRNRISKLRAIKQRLESEIDRSERLKLIDEEHDESNIADVVKQTEEEFTLEVETSTDSDSEESAGIMHNYRENITYETLDVTAYDNAANCYTDEDEPPEVKFIPNLF